MLQLDGIAIEQGAFRLTADWGLAAGGRSSVMGPSGAGKSTLLAAIAGFVPLTAGRILWEGRKISGIPPADRPVAMIFQDNNLFPHLDLATNIALGIRPSGRLDAGERADVADALARVGLDGMGRRHPATLSGGQQSRVALARMLLQAQPLILLDEPFSALGPAQRGEMIDLVKALSGEIGAAILMITHDPTDVRSLGGQTVVVHDGAAHRPVSSAEILANPPTALQAYLG